MPKMTSLRKSVQKASRVPSRMVQRKGEPADRATALHPLLRLQQTAGNQAVGRLIQTKLRVGQPGDRYEQEADRVADVVMRMPEPRLAARAAVSGRSQGVPIQRVSQECEEEMRRQPIDEEEEEETLQAQAIPGRTPQVTPEVQAHINAVLGGGQPLPASVRAVFGPRFGYNFSHVRIHADARAAESAQAVKARAFTIGQHMVFGKGQYAPGTMTGNKLIAHELAHVIQNRRHSTLPKAVTIQRQVIEFEPHEIRIPEARRRRILERAGWRQTNVIVTLHDFLGEPLKVHRVFAEFRAPGVAATHEIGDVHRGVVIWSNVWLQPEGAVRLFAVKLGEAALVPEGISDYTLPTPGALRLAARQRSREVTVTATTSEEAAAKVGVKGTFGVDFKVFKAGGEISEEVSRRRGVSLAESWKVILPTSTFDVSQAER